MREKTAYRKTVWLLILLTLAFAHLADAQQSGKIARVGFLAAQSASRSADRADAFQQGLRDLGYFEGKNIVIEYRWANGKLDWLPGLAADLVRLNLDVIVATAGTPGILGAKNATSAIPIVFAGVGSDAVALGLVASHARPGGNITGVTSGGPELYGKRVELLKLTIPKLSHVAFLRNPDNPASNLSLHEIRTSARALRLQIQSLEVRSPNDLEAAFEAEKRLERGAIIVAQTPPMTSEVKRVVDLTAKHRFAAIYAVKEWPDTGGLMSYGASLIDASRRAATYVDKILKGTKTAELPVEEPTKFELVINLNAAKQIELTIPPQVLARADKVIR